MTTRRAGRLALVIGVCGLVTGCATLEGIRAIPDLEIDLERVEDVRLAEVDVDRVRSYRDLSAADAVRLAEALVRGSLPLELTAVLSALNPSTSAAPVDLLTFDWTLFLDRRETVSGVYTHPQPLPAGAADEIALELGLDLMRFFDGDAEALFDLAVRAAGLGGREPEVELRLKPIVETAFGTVRYPREIVVGSSGGGQ